MACVDRADPQCNSARWRLVFSLWGGEVAQRGGQEAIQVVVG